MIVTGVHNLELDKKFECARRHIFLNAPPYGAFARSASIRPSLEAALARPGGPRLTALDLPDMQAWAWMEDMRTLLRPHIQAQGMQEEIDASRTFLRSLETRFPGRVLRRTVSVRPCLPIIIVDELILFGHFAHGPVMTPDGFWCAVSAPVEQLFAHAESGCLSEHCSPEYRATLRLVSECVHALQTALPVDA